MGLERVNNVAQTNVAKVASTNSPYIQYLTSTVVIDNTVRVTEEQLGNFLASCREKFVKAKIEPGTFPTSVAIALY